MQKGDGKRFLFAAALAFALTGCATAPVITALSPADAEAEIPLLEESIARDENDVDANYRLGLALHALGRDDEAIPRLRKACNLDPGRVEAAFVLGGIYESRGDLAAAEAVLLQAEPDGRENEQLVQATLEEVSRKRDGENIRKILAGESQIQTSRIPENSLAVYEFRPGPSAWELDKMGKALSAVLLTDLSRLSELTLVERRKLATLQQEMSQFGIGSARIDRSSGDPARRSMPDLAPVNQLKGVQERLQYLADDDGNTYYTGPLDGARSEETLAAIRAFQRDRGLGVDGIPGPNTQRNLELAMRDWLAAQSVSGIPPTNGGAAADPGEARVGMLLGARKLISGRYETPNET
ncbi:MAG: hypothetical protein HKN20_13790, partial [Gemmatimonadetes bacterium]|nr:hypothetical protein [Gemmatimonadota bacterium]